MDATREGRSVLGECPRGTGDMYSDGDSHDSPSEILALENKIIYNEIAEANRYNVVDDWKSAMRAITPNRTSRLNFEPSTTVGFLDDKEELELKINDLDREVRRDVRFNQMCVEYHEKGWRHSSTMEEKREFFKKGGRGYELARGYDFTNNFMEKKAQLEERRKKWHAAKKAMNEADSPWGMEEAEKKLKIAQKYKDSVSLNTESVRTFPETTLNDLMDLYEDMRIELMGLRSDVPEFVPGKSVKTTAKPLKVNLPVVTKKTRGEKTGGLARTTSHTMIAGVKCYIQQSDVDMIVNVPTSPRDENF